jgi:hypothetical protein
VDVGGRVDASVLEDTDERADVGVFEDAGRAM